MLEAGERGHAFSVIAIGTFCSAVTVALGITLGITIVIIIIIIIIIVFVIASFDVIILNDPPKDDVLVVEVPGRPVRDEELGGVGVLALVRHREDAAGVVRERAVEFVGKGPVPDGGAAAAGAGGVAGLDLSAGHQRSRHHHRSKTPGKT